MDFGRPYYSFDLSIESRNGLSPSILMLQAMRSSLAAIVLDPIPNSE